MMVYIFFHHLQNIPQIPDDLKKLYRTVWEIPQKNIVKMAADRSPFIDQSQSLNIHIAEPNYGKLTSMHFYGWKCVSIIIADKQYQSIRPLCDPKITFQGLKTGMYYLRTKPAAQAIQFTVDQKKLSEAKLGSTPLVNGNGVEVRIFE